MKDNNNVYERAKALTVDEHAKTTQGGSVYERAKALATDQGVEESLGDLGTRITANAEAYNRALANKNFERAKEDFNKMLEESTLNLKPYATSEDVQMEELNNFMENRANEARMRGVQDYLDQTIGAWGTEKASNAAIDLVGVDAKITTPDALMRSFNNPYSVQTLRDIASQVSDTSFASLPADARSQAEKIADEYIAENPHVAYKRDLYVNYFASQIYDDVFKRKIYTDDKFFADAYEAITGKSYKSYKRDVDKEAVAKLQGMKRELEAMNETLKKKRDEDRTHIGQSRTLFSSAWNDLRNAFGGNIESIEDLIDEIDNVIEGSFTSGFDKGFDFDRMATVGMSGIFTEEEMAEALSKARKGEPLTEEEENYVRIHQYAQELNQLKEVREKYAEQLYDTWFNGRVNFNSIGEGVGTTVEMMPAFAGAMKLTSGIGTFAKIGGMAALKSALEAGGTELFKYGVRTVGKLGYNYGLAKARGLVVSPIMPSTYNTYLESLNSAYSFDGEGNLTYTPVNERQEYLGAIFSTANEVSSEYLGIGIGSVVGWGARGLGRMVANTRLAGVATAAGKKVRTHLPKFTPQTKVAMRTLGVQADPVSETLSEALGDIMTSYEQSMIGMDVDMSQYGTMDYWMTLAGVTLAYGGSIAALGATKSYFDVKQAVKQRDKILGDIENRNLYNTLLAVSTSDDIVLASSALADFDWKGNGIEPQDNDYKLAQTFRVADLNVKIMEGMVGENTRLESFRGTIEGVRDIVYQGKAGEYSDMIFEAEVDGKKVYVINGFEKNSNTGQRIVYDPATGEKTSVDASKVKLTREISVDDYIDEAYANAFSLEMEKERIADIREKALQMNNPTEKDVQRVASTMSIALPKVGNTVMLANGNMGEVTEVLSPAEFVVRDVAGTTYKVHFTDILSTDKLTATAQGAMARGEASTPIYSANETVASTETAEVAETTPETNDENGIAMGAEVTIDGRVGKVRARTQDGRYAVVFETESGNYEDAEIEFFTGEELASLMGIVPAPTAETPAETAQPTETTTEIKATEDGSVDIEQMSAEDAAKALIQRAGTIEEAIAQVKQVIETVTEERKKTAKAQKKASLNDIGKKSAELQALDTRLEFYGEVLGVLETMLAEQQKQTMEAAQRVAEEAGVAAETPTPNEEATTTEEKQGADSKPTVGLIRNGAEMKFTDKVIEMVDFVAKRLGLTVEFVDDLKNEAGQKINGDIKGKHVRLSTSGSRGIKFITGHEFFHRMKDLVDEKTYNDFVESIKAFIGEKEWKAAMAHQRAVYRAHNARVAKDAMKEMSIEEVAKIAVLLNVGIEGLSLDDAKAVVANAAAKLADKGDATAYNLFPQMLKYSDTLMTEECAADIAGALVTNTRVFSDFVENNKSNYALVRGFRKAIRAMREFFDSFGYTEQQRKLKTLDKMLETTLKEAVKNEREGVKKAREEAKKKANMPTDNTVVTNKKGDVEAVTNEQAGQGKFSLSTYREGGRGALADFLDARVAENALTPNEAADMMQQMDDIYEACTTMADKYEPFGQWSEAKVVEDKDGNPVFSVIKANGDYAMNLDFSLVCKKRRTLDAVLNSMVKRGMIKSVSQKDTTVAKINAVIRKYGFETACALCFVDARRFQVIKTARQFCDLYNDMVDLLIPKKSSVAVNEFNFANRKDVVAAENGLEAMSDDALNIEAVRKIGYKVEGKKKDGSDKYGMSVMAKIARHLVEHPEDRKHLSPSDFISTAGFDRVKEQKPAILSLYNAKKGTGGPKAAFSDVQYLNDIIKSNWKVDEAYAVGGVRLQSFSDYVPRMVFDYIQMVAELAAKKLPVHAYTKEALFAKTFGLTGMKINLSLVPDVVEGGVAAGLDAEGNYVWKQGETFPYEEAIALQDAEGYRNNCGTIAVGVSDAHILKMLDDANIRMVIPYHKSGLPKQVAKMNNVEAFTDYTNVQNTTKDGKAITKEEAKEVPNYNELLREYKDARKAAQAYVDWCTERGYTPKFAKFANHPNYYKLLEDFTTMVDGRYAPQEAVTFTFPTEESAFGSLESLIEQGLEEDAVLEGQRDVKVDAIVEEVGEVLGVQPKFSLSEETTQIFDAAKAKFGTTYDMREAGYILPDGSMLDFSGRHQVRGGDTSFLNGDRTVDHREISDIAYDANDNETGINTDLGDFLDRGAIRIDSNAGAINLNVAPTKAQKDRLKRLIERNDGYVYIDFGKGWDTEHYAEYEAARASRVLGDIDRYFDEGIKPTGNVRFSLQEVNTRFNAELATLTEENKDKVILSLGTPSEKLLAGGVVNKPMKLYGAKVIKKQKLHGFDLSEIKNLPLAVANPIAVFNNYQSDENRSVLTELTTKDGNFLVSLNVGKGEDIDFNIVATVFGKGDDNIVDWFNRGLATYIDKEKALDYLHHSALNAEALSNPRLISATNIIQNFQNPKIEARKSLINPEKEDIRYSLGSVEPYASYAKNMARALNIAQPIIVADTTEQFVRLMHDAGSKNPERARVARGVYRPSDDAIFINAEKFEKREDMFECILHEWTHAYTQRNIDKLKAILATLDEERVKAAGAELLPDFYKNESPLTILNEIISNFVGGTPKPLLLAIMRGQMDIAVFVSEAMSVIKGNEYADIFEAVMPVVKENLTNQKERYNGKREEPIVIARWMVADTAQENERPQQYPYRGRQRGGDEQTQYHTGNDRGGAREDAQEVTRYLLPDPDPSEVFYDEMPLYDELGNEIDFNSLTLEEAKEVLDDKVHQMLEAEYDHNVSTIRNEAHEARTAVNEAYREAKSKRRKGEKAARTNAARIDKIFGDTPIESLPYEVQALILIATGEAKIYWGDKSNKRGLASELGLKGSTGDRHAYRNIWGGAKKSFDEVVHSWWESIGGYESGVDTNDLRNALISALQSVQSSKDAMQEIINKYDDLVTERDNVLAEIDRNEEKELHEAKSAYEQHLAAFELAEGEERAAYHDRAAQFFGNQSLSRVEDILEDLAGEIERNKRKIERLKAEKKDAYDTLAEGINKSKEVVLRALERLRMFAGMEEVDLNDVARLINLVKTARSQRQMNNLNAQATALVQRVSIKKAKTNLMRLLSLKLSNTDIIHKMLKESDTWTKEEREAILKHLWKVSRNGLRVSKAVHKDTKEIFDALAEQVKAFKKETKNMKGADLAAKIQSKLAELEKELHPEVVYDGEGNVQDNANLPTDFNAENKHLSKLIFKSYLEMATKEAAYHEASATLREKINNGENTAEANADVVVTRENYLHALTEFNSTLEHLIVKGKDELRDWNAQKEKHEIEIRSMGIRAIGGEKASGQGKRSKWGARQRARWNTTANAPYWTFETVLEKIDHKAPYKKGKMYTYFMDKWADANDDLITRYAAHFEEMAEAMRKCYPNDADNILKMKRNPYKLFQYIMRKAESKPIGTLTYKEMGEDGQLRDAQIVLNIANAMYIIAMWRQPRYQKAMEEKHQITQSDIDALMANIASVDAGFLDFMDWVNEKFLPSTRLEYDVVYRKMNGGSMPKEINYFPARVAGHKEVDLANIDNGALPTTPSALKDRVSAHIMPQLGMDYFKVLESHIQDMDNWAAFAELTSDLNVLLSSDEFRRRCNEYMGGLGGDGGGKGSLYELFKQTSLIATGMYRGDVGIQQLFGQLQKAWATSNIAFRFWTAVKQISSVTTGLTEGWRIALHMGKAASLVGIYSEIKSAMEISPSLRYRWKSGAAGMEALMRETQREDGYTVQRGAYQKTKDTLSDFVNGLVRAGMTPNAAVDLLACSIIVNTVYETEIARLTGGKREATEAEKRAAVRKAERAFNTTQQSSEGAYLAPVQANPAYGVLTTYMNASFALHRKRMGGIKELWKLAISKEYRRYLKDEFGVDAAKVSAIDAFKDIISGLAGELGFAAMGWGLMAFMSTVNGWLNEDDDDEDVAAAKQEFLDASWQFLLTGYLGGSAVSGIFNGFDMSLTPAYEEFAKDVKGIFDDNGNRVWEVAQMAAKYGVGVDLKALQNIGAGLENMFLEENDEDAGAVLKFLNAPSRYIKAFVGDRREGETLEEYQTRIIRFNTLFEDVVYEHFFDKKGNYIGENAPSLTMSKKQAKELRKEYEVAYAKNIIYSNGGSDAYQKYMKTNEDHAKICELLGWSSRTKPSKEKRYVSDMHAELALYQNKVAYWTKARENWIGSEDGYYDLLMEEQKAKNDLINNYYEYIKQTGIGAY